MSDQQRQQKIMKKQLQINQDNDNEFNQSCPPKIEQDITKSINETDFRATKSHQLKVFTDDELMKIKQHENKQLKNEEERKLGIHEKSFSEQKIEVKIIHKKGTDFDCQKVQSVELSCEEESYQSGSIKSKSKKKSQNDGKESKQGQKPRKDKQPQKEPFFQYKRQEIKQDSLNVLVAGAEDTGKTTFVRCFKRKERKNDEPRIKPRTRQIRYQLGITDENLANRRNSVFFIDLAGFSENGEDKYLREIKQYSITQWKHYQTKPQEDRRVHCCLYFLRGPRIKETDIQTMKNLSQLFNLIPVIAKSDQYTKDEIREIKEEFHRKVSLAGEVHFYDIEEFYRLKLGPQKVNEATQSKFGKFPPFVIASSFQRQSPQSNGFVRKYPWGKVEIENEEHTDFEKLCDLLAGDIRSQLLNQLMPLVQDNEPQPQVVEHLEGVIGQQIGQPKIEQPRQSLLTTFVGVSVAVVIGVLMLSKFKSK